MEDLRIMAKFHNENNNKINDDELVDIYFLKIYDVNNTFELLKSRLKINFNPLLIKKTEEFANIIIKNINNENYCMQQLHLIIEIYKSYNSTIIINNNI